MNTATLNIKIDPVTKKQMQEFAADLGMPVSAILNTQIKQMLRDRTLSFSAELKPTPYLVSVMQEAESNSKTKKISQKLQAPRN